jgi:hypothetical protein
MAMSAGERDKMMNDIATVAATEYCLGIEATGGADQARIKQNPEHYLNATIPYLTVRTLHRHEKALDSLKTDSRWIKFLTIALVILTVVLAYYARRLDALIHRLGDSPNAPHMAVEPLPPTPSPPPAP